MDDSAVSKRGQWRLWIRRAVYGAAVAFAVPFALFCCHGDSSTQLAWMLLLPLWLIATLTSIMLAAMGLRHSAPRGLLPLGACIAALVLPIVVAWPVRAVLDPWLLRECHRMVPQFAEEAREPFTHKYYRRLDGVELPLLVDGVGVERDSLGLFVTFFTENGFPVWHTGLIWSPTDSVDAGPLAKQRYGRVRFLQPYWYRF
ncbi:MAG: hypothetical protein U0704_13175 [Candidatus Eisenbacteria bacterium]